ncbi:Hsp20/alpha crystallin family protein [Noviherbaspirillum galbum]|uniref:Hsp20/alpha crystallin family protein n=1 Tax=Noviherbaspirillum galbum TaxID=2709383 RepID=A0A6B3SJL1_9BURK|nr:Hsp20/alpha crystallin family protein [Noviherbaspirillum galbum]NEX60758.1 Hsp20/alpha crystallin family protein [Noviherbaspirillum galbum]
MTTNTINQTSAGKDQVAQKDNRKDQQPNARQEAALLPPVDVIEDAAGITLYADLPGVPKEKLSLHLEADSLTIEGEVALATPEGMESSHAEVRLPRYRRTFTLSRELDSDKATAEFKLGVLTLRIPKAEHAQPRKIEIKVA